MSVSFRLVSIDSLKKGRDSGATPASQSERFCRTNPSLSDKNTARSHLAMGKLRGGESLTEVSKILRYGFWGGSVPSAILQPFRGKKKPSVRTGADIKIQTLESVVYCNMKVRVYYLVHNSDINRMK